MKSIASTSGVHIVPFGIAWAVALVTPGAADWPTYRADARRSGYSPESLPPDLKARWVYRARHAPRPAWSGRDTRMPFDRALHPVIAGGRIFFGTSADGEIVALDAATGEEHWYAFTEGPVRFAPAVWDDRVYAASDDGHLYCLRARDGALLWKRRGGPADSLVLGNDRLISRWPARGGPVVLGGIVYFAAGIWPSEGIYIYALDAETGETVWSNETAGGLVIPQPHSTAIARSGVSAQGYLVALEKRLLVPTGRAVPAGFDRDTGAFRYFHLQAYGNSRGGGSAIVATDTLFFNGGFAFEVDGGQLVEAVADPLTIAVTPTTVILPRGDSIVALARDGMWVEKESVDREGKRSRRRVPADPLWSIKAPHRVDALIAAGDGVVVATESKVSLIRCNGPTAVWQEDLSGKPLGLAVADGRLVVSTDRGEILCFEGGPSRPTSRPENPRGAEPFVATKLLHSAAEAILREGGVRAGWAVDLGCGDAALSHRIAGSSALRIVAVESDATEAEGARRRLDAFRVLGTKIDVLQRDPARTPLPEAFADLVFSWRSFTEGPDAVSREEMLRLARPFGGVVCIGRPDGTIERIVRGPLEGAGMWTHQYCDPGNTNCSADTIVRGPLGVRWFTDFGFTMPSRHGRGPAPLFLDGRLFIEGLDGILAVNAYNGRILWEYEIPRILTAYDQEHLMGTAGTGSNLCVTRDGVYIRTDNECLRLDPATGAKLGAFRGPPRDDGAPGIWGPILCAKGLLFGTLANTDHIVKYRYGASDMRTQYTESRLLFALNAETGAPRWQFEPEHSIRHNAIAVGAGRVYVIDRPIDAADFFAEQAPKRRGEPAPPKDTPARLLCLNATDGTPVWETSADIFGTLLALSTEHGVLVMSYQDTRFKLGSETGGRMAAFRASDGERLWDVKAQYGQTRPMLNGRTIYAQPGAWDLLTGSPKDFLFGRSYGCGIPSGSRHLMVFRSATLGYVDLTGAHGTENYGGIRPGCWINALPAGGLVLMPDATDRCVCSYLLKASIALAPYGLRAPAISPPGLASRNPVEVSLSSDTDEAEIRYTLDGRVPGPSSPRYEGPLAIRETATLKARVFAGGLPPSPVNEAAFIIDPSIIPPDGPHWEVQDSPGGKPPASDWQVRDGIIGERSNLYQGSAEDSDPATERPGSRRIYRGGTDYTDGELSLQIASSDDDVLGVVFRLRGPDRYYIWAMDRQRGFHILAAKDGAAYRLLAQNSNRYDVNRWYDLRVRLAGPRIEVFLDGELDLAATDGTHARGTFGLYAWGCAGAQFRTIRWVAAGE